MKTKVTNNNFEEGSPLKTNLNKKCKKVVQEAKLQTPGILTMTTKKTRIIKAKGREQQKNDLQKVNNENIGEESIDDEISNESNRDVIAKVHEIQLDTKISIIVNDIDDDENDAFERAILDEEDGEDEDEEEEECGAVNCARPMGILLLNIQIITVEYNTLFFIIKQVLKLIGFNVMAVVIYGFICTA